MDWRGRAACRDEDPELFHPVGNSGPALLQTAEAKTVCRRCPVLGRCLAYALDTNQAFGVWGGMSEDERAALLRRQARTRQRSQAAPTMPEPEEEAGPRVPLVRDGEPMAAASRSIGKVLHSNKIRWHAAGADGRSMCGTSILDMPRACPAGSVPVRDRCQARACRLVWRQADAKLTDKMVAVVQAVMRQADLGELEATIEPVVVAPTVAVAAASDRPWHPLDEVGVPACGEPMPATQRQLARHVELEHRCQRRCCQRLWAKLDLDLAVSHG